MSDWAQFAVTLLGGVGLLLLAVSLISEGFSLSAGHTLRRLLGSWTRTTGRGIAVGALITALLQSSSAITIATIGFVNAGLIRLRQAIGIIYGANIGTTATAWLVALFSLKLQSGMAAMLAIAAGAGLRLLGRGGGTAAVGTVLLGFGLFFLGIDALREAFSGAANAVDLSVLPQQGALAVLMYLAAGFAMTVLAQSSSAAIAIILTATGGGIVGLYPAAAMVIGSNLGTTSTAAIAVLGATPNAKRVAAAHVSFNVLTGLLALLLLPMFQWLISNSTGLSYDSQQLVSLALFHSLFNALGVLVMWPFTASLTDFLKRRFVTREELEGRPRYLDKTIAATPALAVNALTLELRHMASIVRRMALSVAQAKPVDLKQIASDRRAVRKLSQAIADFVPRLERAAITEQVAARLAESLRAEQHLLMSMERSSEYVHEYIQFGDSLPGELDTPIRDYQSRLAALLNASDPEKEGFDFAGCETLLKQLELDYDTLKAQLLLAGARQHIPVPDIIDVVEQMARLRETGRQIVKALRHMDHTLSETVLQH